MRRDEPIRANYVRSSRRRPGTRVQEWRSEVTGRLYEAFEANSYELSVDLERGAVGYLHFRNGTVYVTRRAEDRVNAAGRNTLQTETTSPTSRGKPAPAGLLSWVKLALPGSLLLLILWHLL